MQAPPRPRISVVIPHLNQPAMLARCLRSLADQQEAPPFEVIVVDNGSSEPPVDVCAVFGARLLREPVPGPGPARSRGANAAGGDILAFIDADCQAEPGWLAAIAARMEDPGVQVLGGDVRIASEDLERPTVIEAYESIYGYRMRLYIERDHYTATCNMAVRRAVFAEVGPFPGISVAEDVEWGRRASALGYAPIYAPEMGIHTPARASFAELARKWDRHIAHDFAVLEQNGSGRVGWILRATALAASPVAEIPRILRSDRLSGIHPRALAFIGLVRIRLYRAKRMFLLAFGADSSAMSGSWNRL